MPRLDRCRCCAFVLGLAIALPATGAQALIVVNQPWLRPAGSGGSTEAYMNLTATDGATLVEVRSSSAAAVTLQAPGTGKRTAAQLVLPAGKIVELAPGRYRLSLRGLIQAVRLGDTVHLTLTIKDPDGAVQDVAVAAVARLRSPVEDERRAHKHRH